MVGIFWRGFLEGVFGGGGEGEGAGLVKIKRQT